MNEKLVSISVVECYLYQTGLNILDGAKRKDGTLTIEEKQQIFACASMIRELADNVHRLPTAYAVEVVRCKDCKHRNPPYSCPMRKLVMPVEGPGAYEDCTEDDGYCHKGERKEGIGDG